MAMKRPAVVGALLDAWADLDRVTSGLTEADALNDSHGSAYAWTVGHLANQVDSWINVRFGDAEPNPVVGTNQYRFGADGRADSWTDVRAASIAIRASATSLLSQTSDSDLDRTILYPGSLPELQGRQISMRYALLRILAHHYFHVGEVASKRSAAGASVGDYPGAMAAALEADA
jgi:DinB superfamily